MNIQVRPELAPYLDRAVARVGYLFPNSNIIVCADSLHIDMADPAYAAEVARQLHYQLYRERILDLGSNLRLRLYDGLFS